MILTERYVIRKKKKTKELFDKIDKFCYSYKNLRNETNYIIKQCSRICYKLKCGEILDSWEKSLLYRMNCAIATYNIGRKHPLAYLDENHRAICDSYFLSWYMKTQKEWKEIPYSTCGQICIQTLCSDWKAFYKGMKSYQKGTPLMNGKPNPPRYYDKETGRDWIVLTNQITKLREDGQIQLPKFLDGIYLKTKQSFIKQIRIKTENGKIVILVLYEKDNQKDVCPEIKQNTRAMSIDLGIDNFATVTSNTDMQPLLINGKPLKSINQYYNKHQSELTSIAETCNKRKITRRICRCTEKRNNKVKDYMHKASRFLLNTAVKNDIDVIIIGNNQGWKQEVSLGHRTNQNFVGIPYHTFIQMVQYKGEQMGISVIVTECYSSLSMLPIHTHLAQNK